MTQKEYQRQYYLKTKEKRKPKKKEHYLLNKDKVKNRQTYNPEYHRLYYQKNKERFRKSRLASVRAREISKRNRTPKWADLKAIKEFYKNCPPGYHVDHIVPLHGKLVSGLHVLENLQYLPARDNLKKANKYTLD